MTAFLVEDALVAGDIAEDIVATFVSMSRSKANLLVKIAEFDQLDLAHDCGATSTATWMTRRLGISESTAYEYVSVARQLVNFPYLTHVFQEGELSYSVVRLLLKYVTVDNEAELVDMARQLGYHALECALAGKEKPNDDGVRREHYLRMKKESNGDVRFWGRLNSADGEALAAALKIGHLAFSADQDELDELVEGGTVDEERLDALIDVKIQDEQAREARQDVSGFGLPTGRAMIYALMGMVNMVRSHPKSTLRAPGAHVNVMMTVDGRAYLPNNAGASSKALANVAANAMLRLNIVDNHGMVLNTGRSNRLATGAQMNALMSMWGGQCAMPGCVHRRFMEFHHMEEWANGGHTDLVNLLPLCSGCHSLVTDGYVQIKRNGHDIVFDCADGARYVSYNHSLPVRDDGYEVMPQAANWGVADCFAD